MRSLPSFQPRDTSASRRAGVLVAILLTAAATLGPPPRGDETAQAASEPLGPALAVEDTFRMPTTTLPEFLVEAPRVVDVQNALGYLLMHCETPDQAVARSFLNGYESVAALSSREHSLVWPVMMDRLLWLTADILLEKQRKGRSARERLGRRALRLLDWLVDSGLARPPALD